MDRRKINLCAFKIISRVNKMATGEDKNSDFLFSVALEGTRSNGA